MGLDLVVMTRDIAESDLATAFSVVAGHAAIYNHNSMKEFSTSEGLLPADFKLGHAVQNGTTFVAI